MRKQPLPPSVSLSHHGPSSPRPKRTPAQTPLFIATPRVLIEADTPLETGAPGIETCVDISLSFLLYS